MKKPTDANTMIIVKRLPLAGWKYKPTTLHMVEIEIDAEALAREMGERAFRNKSKKSRAQQGVIKCSIRPCTEQPK